MTRPTAALVGLACTLGVVAVPGGVQAPAFDGVWRAEGYGSVLEVAGDSIRNFEVTAISCFPSEGAHRISSDSGRAVFAFDSEPETLEILPGASADERRLHIDYATSDRILHRIDRLPEVCDRSQPDTPLETFDVFWQTYEENYPFFDLRQVDWRAMRERYRPQVADASPADLFATLRAMIEPLHDAHTFLDGKDPMRRFGGHRPEPFLGAVGRATVLRIITARYLQTPLHSWGNGDIAFGMLKDSIGYFRLTTFADYVRDSGYAADERVLDAALDTIFASTTGWRGLVIDVRINSGGDDPLGLAIADRLATASYVAYAKVARSDTSDPRGMTAPQPSVVQPSTRPGWRGPVVVLTSIHSVSAAETFTQALMGRRPAIARVGENTQGVFSDVLGRRLPNGWEFGLPNELYLTEQGTSFDATGIPPTVPVPTFTSGDLAAGRDPGLERAIKLVRAASAGIR